MSSVFTYVPFPPCQLRVSKEQEHFLVLPDGLAYSEVTGSSLVSKTNHSQDKGYPQE